MSSCRLCITAQPRDYLRSWCHTKHEGRVALGASHLHLCPIFQHVADRRVRVVQIAMTLALNTWRSNMRENDRAFGIDRQPRLKKEKTHYELSESRDLSDQTSVWEVVRICISCEKRWICFLGYIGRRSCRAKSSRSAMTSPCKFFAIR